MLYKYVLCNLLYTLINFVIIPEAFMIGIESTVLSWVWGKFVREIEIAAVSL